MLVEKYKLSYLLVVRKFIYGGLTVSKSSIKGKSRLKTDVYKDILYNLIGLNTV